MTAALNNLIEGLKPHAFRGSAAGARLHRAWWGTTTLDLAHLWLDEPMGVRVESNTWVFKPANPDAKEAMAQAGMEASREFTKIYEKPIIRQISTTFFPSVPLAHLAATCEEMSNFPSQEGRQYPFKDFSYVYDDTLDIQDVEQLKRDPTYVQKMADRCLVGYTVPGVTRQPGRLQRFVHNLGFSPS